jgi:K(+)-stimulated pyrophosphate-energized sodium pump
MHPLVWVVGAMSAGFVAVGALYKYIGRGAVDDAKVRNIMQAIAEGAMTFLREEYTIISIVVACVGVILAFFASWLAALTFVSGAILSLITGFIGMRAAIKANGRVTLAARDQGERSAFLIALFGGGVMGFTVASFGLMGIAIMLYFGLGRADFELLITSFGFGASLVAFFARVGGGIYTKSADVGADLVGKLEIGIPEDDPRNPAVIADNVGDCVGDTAGMGADIYESYLSAMISSILLAQIAYPTEPLYIMFPAVISAFGLLGSLVGLGAAYIMSADPGSILRNATYIAISVFLAGTYVYMQSNGIDFSLFVSILVGCIAGIVVGAIAEYYTSGRPIVRLAQASQSGAATNLIYGLSLGMESVVLPTIVLACGVLVSYLYGGSFFGVSLAAVAMLSTVGITMTVDAYGPIADNAGGIAEMAGFGPEVRAITDRLDALGNTTAAIGKGFAIGSALLAALSIFNVYIEKAHISGLNLVDPLVFLGIFIGATIPFLISALAMRSVGEAALKMVLEVRRQFKEIPGLMEGTAKPEYAQCVAIATRAALREMLLPGILTIVVPVGMLHIFGREALGGFLVGATVVGVALALMMSNGGGSWDNAKKYIESGAFGGKGSEAHRAAVVGDTVGDPFKDTAGPALNILIKLMSMLALLLVAMKM